MALPPTMRSQRRDPLPSDISPLRQRHDGELRWLLLLTGALIVTSLLLFAAGISTGFYSDDYQYYFSDPAGELGRMFTPREQESTMYRPLQTAFLAAVQALWGVEPRMIHAVQLLAHVLVAAATALLARRLGHGRTTATIAAVYVVLWQTSTYSIVTNDTLSQICSTLFGICLLLTFRERPLLSLLWYVLGLGMKESTVSYLAPVALIAYGIAWSEYRGFDVIRRAALRIAPFLTVTVAFFLVRRMLVQTAPHFGEGRYDFNLGLNVPINIAQLLVAHVTPVSPADMLLALERGEHLTAALWMLPVLLCGLLFGLGLLMLRHNRHARLVALVLLALMFPTVLMNHVSEHYHYSLLPAGAILVAFSVRALLHRWSTGTAAWLFRSALVLIVGLNAVAIQRKIAMMNANAARAERLIEDLQPWVEASPPGGTIHLLHPEGEPGYSIFEMPGVHVLEYGLDGVARRLGRPDVVIEIVDHPRDTPPPPNRIPGPRQLTLRGDELVELQMSTPRDR